MNIEGIHFIGRDIDEVLKALKNEYDKNGGGMSYDQLQKAYLPSWQVAKVYDIFTYLINRYGYMFELAEISENLGPFLRYSPSVLDEVLRKEGFDTYWKEKNIAKTKLKEILEKGKMAIDTIKLALEVFDRW